MTTPPSNFVVYRGPSQLNGEPIIGVLGCVAQKSQNSKTGPMLMLSVFAADLPPHEAWRSGADAAVCGSCPLRPSLASEGGLRCYVTQKAALFVGRIWLAAKGLAVDLDGACRAIARSRRKLRLGHYGNMSALPSGVVAELVAAVNTRGGYGTCYEHEWRRPESQWLAHFAMASVETEEDALEAQALGWRTYRVKPTNAPLLPTEIDCPHYTRGVQCADCGLCNGSGAGRDRLKSIAVPPKRPHSPARLAPDLVRAVRADRVAGLTVDAIAAKRALGEWRVRRVLSGEVYAGVEATP